MLQNTFLHIPGIGPKTEARIRGGNAFCWSDFRANNGFGISSNLGKKIARYLAQSQSALDRKDISFFSSTLPSSEWWRLYPEFRDRVAFLDIETTGLSFYYNKVTMIGVFNGRDFKAFVRGRNLADFRDELNKYSLLVTYNGALFDLPFLRSEFGDLDFPPVHIDLRFFLHRLGYSGGLKSVERQLGIHREGEVGDVDGFGATILWNRYSRGDSNALDLLMRYNLADVANLKTLMELGYSMMKERVLSSASPRRIGEPSLRSVNQGQAERTNALLESALKLVNLSHDNTAKIVPSVNIDSLLGKLDIRSRSLKVAGIDLTASENRKSGVALMEARNLQTGLVATDSEILGLMSRWKPDLVSIDSPLSLPQGRDCTSDACDCRRFGINRECERILRHRNINVFWCLIQSMQGLTVRGMKLARELKGLGFEVIESYPGAAQDILGITRKKTSQEELKQGLIDFGLDGTFRHGRLTHDELDAITSALVGYFYLADCYEALGNENEGYLIVPRIVG